MPCHSERIGPPSNEPLMKVLPKVAIPLQGIGAPGPLVGSIDDQVGFVFKGPAVGSKVDRERLGQGSQANSQFSSGAGAKAPS